MTLTKHAVQIQYVLVDKITGDTAMWSHQDDMENPVVAPTIKQLICAAAEWADYAVDTFLREMRPGGDFENYIIAREVLIQSGLSSEDSEELKKITAEYLD